MCEISTGVSLSSLEENVSALRGDTSLVIGSKTVSILPSLRLVVLCDPVNKQTNKSVSRRCAGQLRGRLCVGPKGVCKLPVLSAKLFQTPVRTNKSSWTATQLYNKHGVKNKASLTASTKQSIIIIIRVAAGGLYDTLGVKLKTLWPEFQFKWIYFLKKLVWNRRQTSMLERHNVHDVWRKKSLNRLSWCCCYCCCCWWWWRVMGIVA